MAGDSRDSDGQHRRNRETSTTRSAPMPLPLPTSPLAQRTAQVAPQTAHSTTMPATAHPTTSPRRPLPGRGRAQAAVRATPRPGPGRLADQGRRSRPAPGPRATQATSEPTFAAAKVARRGGAWTLVGEVSQRLAQSLTFIALAAILKPSDFGAAAAAFFILQIVYGLTYAGLGSAVQALGPDDTRDRTARGLAAASGLAAGVVLFALARPVSALMHSPDAVNLIRLVAIVPAVQQYTSVAVALLERDFRFRITGAAQVLSSVVSVVVGIGSASLGAGAGALIAAAVSQQVVRFLVIVVADRSSLAVGWSWSDVRELWDVGRHLLATSFAFAVFNNVDTLAVGAIVGPKGLGLYSFAYNAAMTTFFLANVAINRAMLPVLAKVRRQGGAIAGMFASTAASMSWLVSLPIVAVGVQGPTLLHAFFGARWDDAAATLRILSVAAFLRIAAPLCLSLVVVANRSRLLWQGQLLQLLIMAVLLYPLIHVAGIVGGASAVAVSILVSMALLFARPLRIAGLSFRTVGPKLVVGPVAGLVAGFVALQVVGGTTRWHAVLMVAFYLVLFAALAAMANSTVRNWLRSRLRASPRTAWIWPDRPIGSDVHEG